MRIISAVLLCLLPSMAAAQALQPVEILRRFESPVLRPSGALVAVPDGSLYGVTEDAIYRVAPGGQVSVVARITEGVHATGPLVRGADGFLYGVTRRGGPGGWGTVFSFDPATGQVRTVHGFGASQSSDPIGGLALAGGALYGVASDIAGGFGRAIIVRTDPTTGATSNAYVFPLPTPPQQAYNPAYLPTSPLTAGPDGFLYGTTSNPAASSTTFYRFDPASGAVTFVHEFVDSTYVRGPLHRGPDGRLYGVSPTHVYRFDVVAGTYQSLPVVDGAGNPVGFYRPPVVAAPDGTLFGVDEVFRGDRFERIIVRFRPVAGGYRYEEAHTLNRVDGGYLGPDQLALGPDGLIYGYTQTGGAAELGSVYRFDPASDPLQVTVLHAFLEPATWLPTVPTPYTDGALYGMTIRGGANRRGGAYRLLPATGAVEVLSEQPDPMPERGVAFTTPLADGGDGFLYGYTSLRRRNGPLFELRILRVNPRTGAVTVAFQTDTSVWGGSGPSPSERMVRGADGAMYFLDFGRVMRFDPVTNTLAHGADLSGSGYERTALVAASDGQLYFGYSQLSGSYGSYTRTSKLMRVNQAANAAEEVMSLGSGGSPLFLVQGADALYMADSGAIRRIDPAALTHRQVCATTGRSYLSALTAVSDGRLVALTTHATTGVQHLAVCTPASGDVETRSLPPGIGRLTAPLVAAGGWLYGATWDEVVPLRHNSISSRLERDPPQPGGALIRLAVDGALPAIDSDNDGLSNTWETVYGLDPFSATGADGAAGDADGDGRTNAQELADGTHPDGTTTRYFAEGATGAFFRTRLDLANPNDGAGATVLLRFLTDAGVRSTHTVVVEAGSHLSIDPATLPGLAHAAFSTVVEADVDLGVARTMTWDSTGYGSHVDTGVAAPSTTWYFAEGSTSGPFALFYLLQNPNPTAVTATIRYLRPLGLPPVERTYELLPFSRTTISVDGEGPELASTDVSAIVTAPSPIVAERASYYSPLGQLFGAGHESAGVTAPALEWFLAEGATGTFFDLFVLIANPNDTAATVEVEYLLVGGGSLTKTYTVDPRARFTIYVDDEQLPAGSGIRPLAHTAVSMVVRSTNAVPIVVERTMWWPDPATSANYWYEAHNTPGSTTTATRWVVPGAETGGADGAQAYVLIGNPGTMPARVRISLLTDGGRDFGVPFADVPPKSRTSIAFDYALGRPGLLVESLGQPAVPIMVEYATYGSPGGVLWATGGNALAVPLP